MLLLPENYCARHTMAAIGNGHRCPRADAAVQFQRAGMRERFAGCDVAGEGGDAFGHLNPCDVECGVMMP